MKFIKASALLLSILIIPVAVLFAVVDIDLSENILKINNFRFYQMESGFAIYDDGDEQLKIFDWNLQLINQIPLKKGEGPGEIKGDIYSLCSLGEDRFLLNLTFDDNIRLYNLKGKFLENIPVKMQVRQFFKHNEKLILINNNFEKNSETSFFAKILDKKKLKLEKEIKLQGELNCPKELFGADIFLGEKGKFALRPNGNILLLLDSQDFLHEINEKGEIINKIKLPYQPQIDKKKIVEDEAGNEIHYTSWLHSYYNINRAGDNIYICYYKCLKRKQGTPDQFTLYILQILPDSSIKEKMFEQKLFYIIGGNEGMVYLFDANDYHVTGIKESEWN